MRTKNINLKKLGVIALKKYSLKINIAVNLILGKLNGDNLL